VADQPKDRNEVVKKQLLKKRDESAARKVPLAPSEMVDDALARGSVAFGKWLKRNFGVLQWVLVGLVAVGIAYGFYDRGQGRKAEAATSDLVKGALEERGRIAAPESKSDQPDPDDPTPVFKSVEERRDTALASYRAVTSKYPGTGAAILARLGEAGVLLDQRNWDGAVTAYREVKGSKLGTVDVGVRGRAIEGIGLALEGKKDAEGALAAFRELENTDSPGLKELGMYHQARLLIARGDKDKGLELLKKAREKLTSANKGGEQAPPTYPFLQSQVDDLLRALDPTAVPAAAPPARAGGKGMTPEDLKRLQEQFQRKMKEAQEKAEHEKNAPPASESTGKPESP
jgi:tetratricopeptide (TPR) repeat protein